MPHPTCGDEAFLITNNSSGRHSGDFDNTHHIAPLVDRYHSIW